MVHDVFDSPAVPLVIELEEHGFRLFVTPEGRLQVHPGSRLNAEQRRRLAEYKAAVVVLIQSGDPGVLARCDTFRAQLEAAERAALPALLFIRGIPYAAGVCFSCGDAFGRAAFGRCWRCSLAWRLACRLPIADTLAEAVDGAREVA